MNNIIKFRNWLIPGFSFFFLLLFSGHLLFAEPYQATTPVTILSMDTGTETAPSENNLIEWTVKREISNSGENCLSFYLGGTQSWICRLFPGGTENRIAWNKTTRTPQIMAASNLLVVPGSNVPCDVLPDVRDLNKTGSVSYQVKRRIGGQVFADHILVKSSAVSPDEAVKQGWISENSQSQDRLFMISAVNQRTGALLVRQLWVSGSDWWLYEETPVRQSWRMD